MELGKAEEIAARLRVEVISGIRQPGKRIASERDLAEEFGASRMTVRRAIEILEGEGLIVRYPGRGTFVTVVRERVLVDKGREVQQSSEIVDASELRMSGSFLKDMERLGRKPLVQFLEQPALVAADAEVAEHLKIPSGSLVLKRRRLQLADDLPYRLIESYYPADLFGDLLTINIGDQPLFAWLQERHHLNVAHVQETLIARLANQNERQLLRISPNAPVVALDRTVWVDTGRPVEWAHIIAIAALYTFTYDYDISKWNKERKHGEEHGAYASGCSSVAH